ncbi:MAG TPA: selenide, water dikinase SelD [Steroidobacteraceae bacterium]|jgi:selenide,water dikinase|nr:selenide, water dikinase SelD [Steroidobacteraceae bacterium]
MTNASAPINLEPRLTSLSHGGGCGCKIAPGVLAELLKSSLPSRHYADLLVGADTSDDAAVYRLNDDQAVVATTDFFMPIVDDPFDFGRIAATNALADIYAMGGRPLLALAIVGMPVNRLSRDTIRGVLRGGETVCERAGIPVAGGHSIDSVEPIYGLAVTGVVDPRKVKRNSSARSGDILILGKPLGVGIFSAAFKKGVLDAAGYRALIDTTTQLNLPGMELSGLAGVHAMTDVTGFGLLGHLLEMCGGSGLCAQIAAANLPLLPGLMALARAGIATGASARNWQFCSPNVELSPHLDAALQVVLTDPQTSGGLLVACERGEIGRVMNVFERLGFAQAAVIGSMSAGDPKVRVD